jgi:hypothetical protein
MMGVVVVVRDVNCHVVIPNLPAGRQAVSGSLKIVMLKRVQHDNEQRRSGYPNKLVYFVDYTARKITWITSYDGLFFREFSRYILLIRSRSSKKTPPVSDNMLLKLAT